MSLNSVRMQPNSTLSLCSNPARKEHRVVFFAGARVMSMDVVAQTETALRSLHQHMTSMTSCTFRVAYGGGDSGLMGVVRRVFHAPSGDNVHLESVYSDVLLRGRDVASGPTDETDVSLDTNGELVVKARHGEDRLLKMLQGAAQCPADTYVVCLPGGFGTLSELFSTLDLKKAGLLPDVKGVFLVELAAYAQGGLKAQLKEMVQHGCLREEHRRWVSCVNGELLGERLWVEVALRLFDITELNVVVPTTGARSLKSALTSVKRNLDVLSDTSVSVRVRVVLDCPPGRCDEAKRRVEQLCADLGIADRTTVLENTRTPQSLSGALNTAIAFLVSTHKKRNIANVFVACLDDDDEWDAMYLHTHMCSLLRVTARDGFMPQWQIARISRSSQPSVVRPRSIDDISIQQFLVKNPGVQGSNLFVSLEALCSAGMFDEMLPSCTDRDLCVRLLLHGTKPVLLETPGGSPLVLHHDDPNDTTRLSNPANPAKLNGLTLFYLKWRKLFDQEGCATSDDFFSACFERFNLSKIEIMQNIPAVLLPTARGSAPPSSADLSHTQRKMSTQLLLNDSRVLFIGFASSSRSNVERMLLQVNRSAQRVQHRLIAVCLWNSTDCAPEVPEGVQIPAVLVPLSGQLVEEIAAEARGHLEAPLFSRLDQRLSIAESRHCVQRIAHAFQDGRDGGDCPLLILDDDKEFEDADFVEFCLTRAVRPEGGDEILLGGDARCPPLPVMSCWRTQCTTLLHAFLAGTFQLVVERHELLPFDDSYYDHSTSSYKHLEYEADPHVRVASLRDVEEMLAKMVRGQPLSPYREACNAVEEYTGECWKRGGVCLIARGSPLPSMFGLAGSDITRRSDWFWAHERRARGAHSTRSSALRVKHFREDSNAFLRTPEELVKQFASDLYGAALYRKIERCESDALQFLRRRVASALVATMRVGAAIDCIRDRVAGRRWCSRDDFDALEPVKVIRDACTLLRSKMEVVDESADIQALRTVRFSRDMCTDRVSAWIRAELSRAYLNPLRIVGPMALIGHGSEGAVFLHHAASGAKEAIKVFYQRAGTAKIDIELLRHVNPGIAAVPSATHTILRYPYVEGAPYAGGHGRAVYKLARLLHSVFVRHSIVFMDTTPKNLLISPDGLVLSVVDYGRGWVVCPDQVQFEISMRRLFSMFLFAGRWRPEDLRGLLRRLSEPEACLDILGSRWLPFCGEVMRAPADDAAYAVDETVFREVVTWLPREPRAGACQSKCLDFGCGGGSLTRRWKERLPHLDVRGYDPLAPLPDARTDMFVARLEDLRLWTGHVDRIVLSRVLCVLADDNDCLSVLQQVQCLLSQSGEAKVFVCCNNAQCSCHDRRASDSSAKKVSRAVARIEKQAPTSGRLRCDYSRSHLRLLRLFAHAGFELVPSDAGSRQPVVLSTFAMEELVHAPTLLAYTLRRRKAGALTTTLLLRACPQDAHYLYPNVLHITNALQRGRFFDAVHILVDAEQDAGVDRPRRFTNDDSDAFHDVLNRLTAEGIVDGILRPRGHDVRFVNREATHSFVASTAAHHADGVPYAASLHALLVCKTDLVLHMDCDMLFYDKRSAHDPVTFAAAAFESEDMMWTLSLPVPSSAPQRGLQVSPSTPFRLEVRGGWVRPLFVRRMMQGAPLLSDASDLRSADHWYRLLDKRAAELSMTSWRYAHDTFWMLHVENRHKPNALCHRLLIGAVDHGRVSSAQQLAAGNGAAVADLQLGAVQAKLVNYDVVLVACGRKVPTQLKARCAESIRASLRYLRACADEQYVHMKFGVVVAVDHTTDDEMRILQHIFRACVGDDLRVIGHYTTRESCLGNLCLAVNSVCDGDPVIVTIDLDDELPQRSLLEVATMMHGMGRRIAAGGMWRTAKAGFVSANLHMLSAAINGSTAQDAAAVVPKGCNPWSHLRAFRRSLFLDDRVQRCLRDATGRYWDLANDWAFMVPMTLVAIEQGGERAVGEFPKGVYLYDRRYHEENRTLPALYQGLPAAAAAAAVHEGGDERESTIGQILQHIHQVFKSLRPP